MRKDERKKHFILQYEVKYNCASPIYWWQMIVMDRSDKQL